jgi:XTP/dITP diphosphohydrolase
VSARNKAIRLTVASSNAGKLREYQALAALAGASLDLVLLPNFDGLPKFDEAADTFGENAVGKALHYSHFCDGMMIADDSGLVVPALGGAPGVHSARYAGPDASDADRIRKLIHAMNGKKGEERRARFVCVVALVEHGEACGIFSASAEGELLKAPRGTDGFGYDPIFFSRDLGKTFAETNRQEKNQHSHRGKAFRKALDYLLSADSGA